MTANNLPRKSFDEVAILYNEARPHYPDELFSTLVDKTALSVNAKLLEIGPGTGQATKPLAKRGFDISAVELGPALSEVAKNELQAYKNVDIKIGTFEEIELPTAYFDLVFSATAFHWIAPEMKYSKTHRVLKENGFLAIIQTNHISDENGDQFFNVSQPIYDRYDFTDKEHEPKLPRNEDLEPDKIDTSLFSLKHFQTFPVVITYSAGDYTKLLNTYSNHLAATKEIQRAFYNEIENLINDKFDGRIEKHFSMSLTIAQKK